MKTPHVDDKDQTLDEAHILILADAIAHTYYRCGSNYRRMIRNSFKHLFNRDFEKYYSDFLLNIDEI